MTARIGAVLGGLLLAAPVAGQEVSTQLATGDSLQASLQPAAALEHFRAAIRLDGSSYEALWKFAGAQIDVAKQLNTSPDADLQDSLYLVAHRAATAAVRANPSGADGHFMLAQALGRLSRTKNGQERVQFGREIYDEAKWALDLAPDHDGAHHVIGAWHAEVRRLSGVMRFIAQNFLGGGYMKLASWDSAMVHLERSVDLRPEYLFHRLELAQIYIDVERFDDARRQLRHVLELPHTDVSDPEHQETARRLLAEIPDGEPDRKP